MGPARFHCATLLLGKTRTTATAIFLNDILYDAVMVAQTAQQTIDARIWRQYMRQSWHYAHPYFPLNFQTTEILTSQYQ